MTNVLHRITIPSSYKTNISVSVAGDKQKPAILLFHGFPSSAKAFRDIIPTLAETCYVIAPDLPGAGDSDILPTTSFSMYAKVILEVLEYLEVGPRFIYIHDWGAPVGLQVAMNAPEQVLGLIVQNANAHRSGFDPATWKDAFAFWENPTPENEAATMQYLTPEGMRAQYIAGLPDDVAKRISPSVWEEDWRVLSRPGRLDVARNLIADYVSHIAQFDAYSEYLRNHQPPALMLWGRHDPFFDIAETVSWMQDLPRMEAHILDGGHFLLETHAKSAARLLRDFVTSVR